MRSPRHWKVWKQVADFIALWGLLLGGVFLLAGAEAVVIWSSGFRYEPDTQTRSVWFEDLSFQRSKRMAAAVVCLRQNALAEGVKSDVVLMDFVTRRTISLDASHLNPIAVALSPDASTVAVVGADATVRLITDVTPMSTARLMAEIETIDGAHVHHPIRLRFSPDGEKLAAISEHSVWVWSLSENRLLHEHRRRGNAKRSVQKVLAFTRDSQCIIAADSDGGISIRDLHSGKVLKRDLTDHHSLFDADLFQEDRLLAVASNGTPHEVSVYTFPVDQGKRAADESGGEARLWTQRVSDPVVALGGQGSWVATSVYRNDGHQILIRDIRTGRERCMFAGHESPIVGFASSGQTLYSWDSCGSICEWDIATKQRTYSFSMLQWVLDSLDPDRIRD
ncbi:hypothetical protein Mal15_51670 [Stieleria maiorica]|uniref:WD domain, G-beta repeat n=1 Tax=Stieleria maiorica TaxID=2795974 RepID=A0A5B9MM45_9BACT|nr:hypothetical protein [Stieleria maiorica]QEG01091.1 hypothetical protein Mal15_51670 [Stieleria maiorica]